MNSSFVDELEKIAFNKRKFREGLIEEGVPLTGATIGAAVGGLRGAALGYAGGGLASLGHARLRGHKPSEAKRILAGSAIGYGVGGLAHLGLSALAKRFHASPRAIGRLSKSFFHINKNTPETWKMRFMEEALPAAGATIATGIGMGMTRPKKSKSVFRSVKSNTFNPPQHAGGKKLRFR